MSIIAAAVGDNLKEFDDGADIAEVWAFVNQHLSLADVERAVVLRDESGATLGELWDSSSYFAHWETPAKMQAYLSLIGFDQDG